MSELENILTRLENAVEYDVRKRLTQHTSGKSPKQSHFEAKTAIKSLMEDLAIDHVANDGDLRRIQEALEKL